MFLICLKLHGMKLEKKYKIGFVNGCFDILHIGHIRMLQFAKANCDYLIVAIDSDERVSQLKGSSRPVNNVDNRSELLLELRSVDAVKNFSSANELIDLIKSTAPDIMVVGSDYKNKEVIGSQHAKELLFFNRIEGHSTSITLECLGNR
jgi:rfaE bifunctional protein nucleotidyltransferase chain/domain